MGNLFTKLETLQESYLQILNNGEGTPFVLLIALGFLGGLVSSLLPCVLSLLPINLAYIGTLKIKNRKEAFYKAALFVLGVVVVLSILGVSAGLAFAVFTEYRSWINLVVGLLVTIMALALIDVIKLPLPQFFSKMPEANPFIIGLIFALVSSPCSSPVLVSVISIAANLGSVLKSFILMFGYSLGYTAIIFFASLFTGFAKQLNWFKANSELIVKLSAAILALMGVFYTYAGVKDLL